MVGVTRGWLRRNEIALIALAVLLPGAAATIISNEWMTANAYLPHGAIEVAEGDLAELYGTTFGPAKLRAATADELESALLEPPAGSRAVVVEFTIVNGDTAVLCSVRLREVEGAHREWKPVGSDAACAYDVVGPFEGSVLFLVPDDADGPFWADVDVSDMEDEPAMFPPFLRFSLD